MEILTTLKERGVNNRSFSVWGGWLIFSEQHLQQNINHLISERNHLSEAIYSGQNSPLMIATWG